MRARLSIWVLLTLTACGSAKPAGKGGEGGGGSGGSSGAGGAASGGAGGAGGVGGNGLCDTLGAGGAPPQTGHFADCTVGFKNELCATMQFPLDWSNPSGPMIDWSIRRLDPAGTPRARLFMLQGGPGISSQSLFFLAHDFLLAGFQVYLPEYRGLGDSDRLACSAATANAGNPLSAPCLAEVKASFGDSVRFFGTTDAARDVAAAIRIVSAGTNLPNLVWSSSYGTLMANRLLHLMPQELDGVVIDSSCPPAGCDSVGIDRNLDLAQQKLAAVCATDSVCSAKLGADPWARIHTILDGLAAGSCAGVIPGIDTREYLRLLLAGTIGHDTAFLGFSAAYRLGRCDPADRTAIQHLQTMVRVGPSGLAAAGDDAPDSTVLGQEIVDSEFWDHSVTLAQVQAQDASLAASAGGSLEWAQLFPTWPLATYVPTPCMLTWAPTDTPLLLLEGTLDPRTPPEQVADFPAAHPAPWQQELLFPWAVHGVMTSSQVEPSGTTCGRDITLQFVKNPTGTLDTSCIAQVTPPDVSGSPGLAQSVYGTSDVWENPAHPPPNAVGADITGLLTALRRNMESLRPGF